MNIKVANATTKLIPMPYPRLDLNTKSKPYLKNPTIANVKKTALTLNSNFFFFLETFFLAIITDT